MRLTGIYLYPVKSLRGLSVRSAEIDELGLVGDRRFMVVDEQNRFLTQRTLPRMALVSAALDTTHLILSADGRQTIRVPQTEPAASLRSVTVWESENMQAEDCGDIPARWLAEFLETKCRLVRIGRAFRRPVIKPGRARPEDIVSFADLFPFLIVSEESLSDLNRRIEADGGGMVPMNRFRPNFVVSGCEPFAEDTWERFRIGGMVFRAGGPCARCAITTTDQFTGERGKEPLRTLATFRRDIDEPAKVNFAQNIVHETKIGTLRVGEVVTVL